MSPSAAHLPYMSAAQLPFTSTPHVHDSYGIPSLLPSLLTSHTSYEHLLSSQPPVLAFGGLTARLTSLTLLIL